MTTGPGRQWWQLQQYLPPKQKGSNRAEGGVRSAVTTMVAMVVAVVAAAATWPLQFYGPVEVSFGYTVKELNFLAFPGTM